ncbi:uncharacterized protein B0I36DRAFT_282683 [Microdochium trichocladiopsis]|uniref:Rhodopsin domain-containing protein n=1 Tax=Microdochium trichocladiopsis TaxID=1682393 RepID=A0A9P8YDK3_9PEZI|nr:uncharacterized protein B0I36DRAFT_282683 [Microdochium trichocladiopsis]KAH7037026.1 hypothetical protein B0I36DRAFT_282683 [Microdochium trichocladiopsis]
MVGAILAGGGFAATSVPLYWYGLGRDIWTVPFEDITKMLIGYYHGEWVYAVAIFFTKMSLLLFYLRVFPVRNIRIQVYVLMGCLVTYSILAVAVSCNQCRPVWGAWEYWHGEADISCLDRNALGWASAVVNMSLDIAIIVLPLRPLSKLAMSKRKKAQVIIMFMVGTFVTVVSIVRLQSLIHFSHSTNPTWDYREMGYWSQIEVHVGNVCACMPATYSLLKKALPSIMGSSGVKSKDTMQSDDTGGYLSHSSKPTRIKEDHEQNFVRLQDFEPGKGAVREATSTA